MTCHNVTQVDLVPFRYNQTKDFHFLFLVRFFFFDFEAFLRVACQPENRFRAEQIDRRRVTFAGEPHWFGQLLGLMVNDCASGPRPLRCCLRCLHRSAEKCPRRSLADGSRLRSAGRRRPPPQVAVWRAESTKVDGKVPSRQ